jgi:hypothetical protein
MSSASKELKAIGITRVDAAILCGKHKSTLTEWFKHNKPLWDIFTRGLISKLRDKSTNQKKYIIFETKSASEGGLNSIFDSSYTLEEAYEIAGNNGLVFYQIVDRDTWQIVE